MIDAGLFEPFIKRLLKAVKGDPVKIALGTAILALAVALDGDGTTTYMITVFNVSLRKTDDGVDELSPLVQEQDHLLWYHK